MGAQYEHNPTCFISSCHLSYLVSRPFPIMRLPLFLPSFPFPSFFSTFRRRVSSLPFSSLIPSAVSLQFYFFLFSPSCDYTLTRKGSVVESIGHWGLDVPCISMRASPLWMHVDALLLLVGPCRYYLSKRLQLGALRQRNARNSSVLPINRFLNMALTSGYCGA